MTKVKRLQWNVEEWEGVRQARTRADLESDDELSVVFGFQGTSALERDPENIRVFDRLGVKIMQLTYNARNLAGDDRTERTDAGISNSGFDLIDAMEWYGVVLDLSQAGHTTAAEALDTVDQPSLISHSNPLSLFDHPRNVPDEPAKAVAETDGVVGATAFPPLVSKENTIDDMLDAIEYWRTSSGPNTSGSGWTSSRTGRRDRGRVYPSVLTDDPLYLSPPFSYPEGVQSPIAIATIAVGLSDRGFRADEIRGIVGENLLRVIEAVWGT